MRAATHTVASNLMSCLSILNSYHPSFFIGPGFIILRRYNFLRGDSSLYNAEPAAPLSVLRQTEQK